MILQINIRQAFANLLASKLRSFLAVLGVLVGTGSVVAMVSCGELASEAALAQFKRLGTGLMSVSINPHDQSYQKNLELFEAKSALSLQKASSDIEQIAPYATTYVPVTFRGENVNGSIIGVTHSLQKILKIKVIKGRFISDLDGFGFFCVIGNSVYKDLKRFGVSNPVGMQIRLGTEIFTIAGVTGPWEANQFFNQDINYAILVPVKAAKVLSKYALINNIILYLREGADIDGVKAALTLQMEHVLPGMDLLVRSAKQIIESMEQSSRIFTLLLGLIGSISLLVGGIGVMNIMLVSVIERKREIGIRMAVGARRKDIQALFLIESVTLSVFGGLLGVILGVVTSYIISRFADWPFQFFLLPPLVGFAVSVATGIFFGFYPAYQASQLDPIQTLRSE